MPSRNSPIGVFDSGIGGLTVVRELIRLLPGEGIVYLGDTARVPYGTKSRQTVRRFAAEDALFLLRHDVKLIIIACHTASSFALDFLRRRLRTPVLGVVGPGAEAALEATRSGRIGVIGTQATVASGAYRKALLGWGRPVRVFQAACPLFVPLVEEGRLNGSVTLAVARGYLQPIRRAGVDALILGCTHYPLLKATLARVMGPRVRLVDSARAVALKARDLLAERGELRRGGRPARRFFVTDEPAHFARLAARFLGQRPHPVSKVDVSNALGR